MVNAYTDAFGPAPSGAFSVMSGSVLCAPEFEPEADARSHNLIVRSNEPEANHCCSRLHNVRREEKQCRRDSPVREAADVVGVCAYYGGFVQGAGGLAMRMRGPRFDRPV